MLLWKKKSVLNNIYAETENLPSTLTGLRTIDLMIADTKLSIHVDEPDYALTLTVQ